MLAALNTRPLGTPRALHAHLPIAGDPASRPGQTCVTGTPRHLIEREPEDERRTWSTARTSAERRWLDDDGWEDDAPVEDLHDDAPPAASYRSPFRPIRRRDLLPWRTILGVAALTACAAMAGAWFERATHEADMADEALPPPIELLEVEREPAPVARPVPARGEPAPTTASPAIRPRKRSARRRKGGLFRKSSPKAKPKTAPKPAPIVIPSSLPPFGVPGVDQFD